MNLEFLQAVALSVANEREISDILKRIVSGLTDRPEVALARIWLVEPGDICETCPAKADCRQHVDCLHLVASDGHPLSAKTARPVRLDGEFRRFPISDRKVGRIAETGDAILLTDIESNPPWLKYIEWAQKEQIRSFAGQPLIFRGEVLGVLAIFSRSIIDKSELAILRTFADNAAAAISNAKAFEEIRTLQRQLEAENEYLRDEIHNTFPSGSIIGNSPAIKKMLDQIQMVAPTDSTVLIQGESGTGKELVAQEIHKRSNRSDKPMVRVNCASIPKELFESEFFGHKKGAFTGAVSDRIGRFQLADKGTLFLDEIGEIPIELQPKLLRVIQEGEFETVGDDKTKKVDVRIVAATNRDLQNEVAKGKFREDLFYRLSVFPVEVVPLRNRTEDIGLLAAHFLNLSSSRLSIPAPTLRKKHVNLLKKYSWPGNVRELVNVIERAVITSRGDKLQLHLDFEKPNSFAGDTFKQIAQQNSDDILTAEEMRALERENIIAALNKCGGKIRGKDGAAALLDIKPTTLSSKIKSLKIKRSE